MGITSDKEKYFKAYKSIKLLIEKTHYMNGIVEDAFLIDTSTINKFMQILLKKHEILSKIANIAKRNEVTQLEKKIKKDFGDYKLEKNIKVIDIEDEDNINKVFIIVDKDFLVNMNINFKEYENKKISINVKKEGLEIKLKSKEEYTENIIKIEEVKKGIYKFGEKEEIEDPNGNTIFEESKKEEIDDPEIDPRIRIKPIDQSSDDDKKEETKENEDNKKQNNDDSNDDNNNDNVQEIKFEEEKQNNDKNDEINNENKNEGQKNLINIINDDNQQIKRRKAEPQYAKYNELIYLIYSSLVKSNEQKDTKIEEKISELKIKNELDIKEIYII